MFLISNLMDLSCPMEISKTVWNLESKIGDLVTGIHKQTHLHIGGGGGAGRGWSRSDHINDDLLGDCWLDTECNELHLFNQMFLQFAQFHGLL